jgi:hypothetical protein
MSDEARRDETAAEDAPRGAAGPSAWSYVHLNLGVWAFLAVVGFVLAELLGDSRTIALYCALLAIGFSAVSVFDFLWLQWKRRDGAGGESSGSD